MCTSIYPHCLHVRPCIHVHACPCCPGTLRARCQPARQPLARPSDARDMGTFTSLFSLPGASPAGLLASTGIAPTDNLKALPPSMAQGQPGWGQGRQGCAAAASPGAMARVRSGAPHWCRVAPPPAAPYRYVHYTELPRATQHIKKDLLLYTVFIKSIPASTTPVKKYVSYVLCRRTAPPQTCCPP